MDDQERRIIIAKTLWAECRGEPLLGQIAVARVIANRGMDHRWPYDLAEVCLQPRQFSCWDDGRLAAVIPPQLDSDWLRAFWLADALLGQFLGPDPTAGANHYLNPSALAELPSWARDRRNVTLPAGPLVGRHDFYRL